MRAVRVNLQGRPRIGLQDATGLRLVPEPRGDLIGTLARDGWGGLDAEATDRLVGSDIRYLAPVPRPGKILGVGLNYADHAEEQGLENPDHPILFAKMPTAVIGPGDPIPLHSITEQTDYEAELAVVIGHRVRGVSASQALDAVAGFTILNDVTARDLQFSDRQWVRGKSLDGYAPMGPTLASPDTIGDGALAIRCYVNEELRQSSNTSRLVFDVPALVAFCSEAMTLEPGDVIATGTPGGVGVFMDPPRFLKSGDVVRIEIEGIGTLTNPVGDT